MASKQQPVAEKDTTVTVPIAKFFKNVKVNGIQGTVTFHAGPHIGMAKEALDAKIGSGSKNTEAAELRSEIDRLKSALEKAKAAAASKSKPRAEEGVMDVSASKASDDSKLGEDGPPAKKKSRKGKDE